MRSLYLPRPRGWTVTPDGEVLPPSPGGIACGLFGHGMGHPIGQSPGSPTDELIRALGGGWFDANVSATLTPATQPTWTNADFSAWTGAYPDETLTGWVKAPSPGTVANHIANSPAGSLNITSDGTYTAASLANATITGNRYQFGIACTAFASGSVTVSGSAANYLTVTALGNYAAEATADNTTLSVKRAVACDASVDNLTGSNLSQVSWKPKLAAPLNLLADGDAEDPTSALWIDGTATWSKVAGARTGGSGSRIARLTRNTGTNGYQSCMFAGRTYRIRGWARGDGTASPRLYDGTYFWDGTSSTDWQYFDVIHVAAGPLLYFIVNAVAGAVDWDDVTVEDVTDPCGVLANTTAANQWWLSQTLVNGRRVLQLADTDVGLSSLPASAWRFLHCGSGGALPRFMLTIPLRELTTTSTRTLIDTTGGAQPGIYAFVTNTGQIVVAFYNAAAAPIQTFTSAAGFIVAGSTACITIWADGTSLGVLRDNTTVIGPTAMTFVPQTGIPAAFRVGGTQECLLAQVIPIAGYKDDTSRDAHHREICGQMGIAA